MTQVRDATGDSERTGSSPASVTLRCPRCNDLVSKLVGNMPTELSLRDYFAAAALMGQMAGEGQSGYKNPILDAQGLAAVSYKISDALLAQRGRG